MIALNEVRTRDRTPVVAAFEASVLVRCTGVPDRAARRSGGAPVVRCTGPLAEFNRAGAADRLAELLAELGRPADVRRYTAGTRHRYEISQVFADAGTAALLERTWRQGFADICGEHQPGRPAGLVRPLAEAAWRAAMLASGPTRANAPGLRVGDLDTARMLVRAGRALRVPVRMRGGPGGQLLLVIAGA